MMDGRTNAPILRFDHVTVSYDGVAVLCDISFEAFEGDSRVILGAAGSGKTVLLKTALALIRPDEGKVYAFGRDLTEASERELFEIRSKIGMLFQEGCVGAGTGATVGKALGMGNAMKSGIGSSTVALPGGVLVSSLVAVNAFGDVRDPANGQIVAGVRKATNSREFANAEEVLRNRPPVGLVRANTTLAVVATNASLTKTEVSKLAQLASLGTARAIYPVNTMMDGDVTFALSLGDHRADINVLGSAAAEAVVQSILRAVKLSKTLGGVPGLA